MIPPIPPDLPAHLLHLAVHGYDALKEAWEERDANRLREAKGPSKSASRETEDDPLALLTVEAKRAFIVQSQSAIRGELALRAEVAERRPLRFVCRACGGLAPFKDGLIKCEKCGNLHGIDACKRCGVSLLHSGLFGFGDFVTCPLCSYRDLLPSPVNSMSRNSLLHRLQASVSKLSGMQALYARSLGA
jgi:hypothetical protein